MTGNSATKAAATYRQQDIQSADPVQLIVHILELGSLHAVHARAAMVSGDLSAKGRSVHQLSRCIALLQDNLDMDRGGEPARNMDRLYAYLLRRLSEGHLRNDQGALSEIAGHLSELGSAWREAAKRRLTQGAGAAP